MPNNLSTNMKRLLISYEDSMQRHDGIDIGSHNAHNTSILKPRSRVLSVPKSTFPSQFLQETQLWNCCKQRYKIENAILGYIIFWHNITHQFQFFGKRIVTVCFLTVTLSAWRRLLDLDFLKFFDDRRILEPFWSWWPIFAANVSTFSVARPDNTVTQPTVRILECSSEAC